MRELRNLEYHKKRNQLSANKF